MKNVLILGGGTVGTMVANRLVRELEPSEWQALAASETLNVSLLGLLWRARQPDVRRGIALLLRLVEVSLDEPKS